MKALVAEPLLESNPDLFIEISKPFRSYVTKNMPKGTPEEVNQLTYVLVEDCYNYFISSLCLLFDPPTNKEQLSSFITNWKIAINVDEANVLNAYLCTQESNPTEIQAASVYKFWFDPKKKVLGFRRTLYEENGQEVRPN